jgi:hypothetical protein
MMRVCISGEVVFLLALNIVEQPRIRLELLSKLIIRLFVASTSSQVILRLVPQNPSSGEIIRRSSVSTYACEVWPFTSCFAAFYLSQCGQDIWTVRVRLIRCVRRGGVGNCGYWLFEDRCSLNNRELLIGRGVF